MSENPIFNEFEMNDATDYIFGKVYFGDIFNARTVSMEDIKTALDLENRSIFKEGVVSRLNSLGIICKIDDQELIVREVKKRYKMHIGEDCPKTILKWLEDTLPSTVNRINNYNLCYALEMSLQETAEFFLKYFLTVPFNYKDKTDAVFFYCLAHNKPYSVIKEMITEANTFANSPNINTETLQIGRQILDIDDDQEFIQYLAAHCFSNEQQYQLARKEIINFIDRFCNGNFSDFHDDLMGFNYQSEKRRHKIKNTDLPDHFTQSLPTDGVLKQIYEGKKETYETIRKSLIILKLYEFYNGVYETDEIRIQKNLNDFYDETNKLLMRCGLAHLYVRHPFDWIIVFCALSTSPMNVFHEINQKRYK